MSGTATIEHFLDDLVRRGIAIGLDERIRLIDLLRATPDLSPNEFRGLVVAVLAKTKESVGVVSEAFAQWEKTVGFEIEGRGSGADLFRPRAPDIAPYSTVRAPWWRRLGGRVRARRKSVVAALGIVLVGAVIFAIIDRIGPNGVGPSTTEPRGRSPIPTTDRSTATIPSVTESDRPVTTRPNENEIDDGTGAHPAPTPEPEHRRPRPSRVEIFPATPRPSLLFVTSAGIGLIALAILLRTRRMHIERPKLERIDRITPPEPVLTNAVAAPPFLSREERRAVVWNIESFVAEEPTSRIDLARTVHATARAAGMVAVHYERPRHPKEVWLIHDEQAETDAPRRLSLEIRSLLERTQNPVRAGYFYGSPDRIRWIENGEDAEFTTLEGRREQVILALMTEGHALLHPDVPAEDRDKMNRALASAATFPRAALIEFDVPRVLVDAGENGGRTCGESFPKRRLAPLGRRFGIRTAPANEIAGFLSGITVARSHRPSDDDLPRALSGRRRLLASALAVGRLAFDEADAVDCARKLKIAIPRHEIIDILRYAEADGLKWRFQPGVRRELVNWLRGAEQIAGGSNSSTSFDRAVVYWQKRFATESSAAPEDRSFALEMAVLGLFREPNEAAQELERFAIEASSTVAERLYEFLPLDAPNPQQSDASTRIRLPWLWDAKAAQHPEPPTEATKFLLRRLGFYPDMEMEETRVLPRMVAVSISGLVAAAILLAIWGCKQWSVPEKTRVVIDMAAIPGTTSFMMGSPETEDAGTSYRGDEDLHGPITLSPFRMSRCEITRGLYRDVMGGTPANVRDDPWKLGENEDRQRPATEVSWHEAVAFCERLNEIEGRSPEEGYRLPTEAEWEYACRAGTKTRFWNGTTEKELAGTDWFIRNSGSEVRRVGLGRRNPFGLFDMQGNVAEWCSDVYAENSTTDLVNPKGPTPAAAGSAVRVIRGGSAWYYAVFCRSAYRRRGGPSYRSRSLGFRVVLPELR